MRSNVTMWLPLTTFSASLRVNLFGDRFLTVLRYLSTSACPSDSLSVGCMLVSLSFLFADTQLYKRHCPSVRRSVVNISELRAFFALLHLPNRPRLSCHVSGLVFFLLRLSVYLSVRRYAGCALRLTISCTYYLSIFFSCFWSLFFDGVRWKRE